MMAKGYGEITARVKRKLRNRDAEPFELVRQRTTIDASHFSATVPIRKLLTVNFQL